MKRPNHKLHDLPGSLELPLVNTFLSRTNVLFKNLNILIVIIVTDLHQYLISLNITQHKDHFRHQHVNPHLIRNDECIQLLTATQPLFYSLVPTRGTHSLPMFRMLMHLVHLRGWFRNTLLIHTDVYILFVLLTLPRGDGRTAMTGVMGR